MNRSYPRLGFFASWAFLLALTLVSILVQTGRINNDEVAGVVVDLRNNGLNDVAIDLETENYYQQFTSRRNTETGVPSWARRATATMAKWLGYGSPEIQQWESDAVQLVDIMSIMRESNDYLVHEFRPSARLPHKGVTIITNSWGMRDDEYSMNKPPDTFRIALVGGSNTMGWGVEHEETFEALLETNLNGKLGPRTGLTYEILNFSAAGYFLDRRLYTVTEKMRVFDPDLIFVVATMHDRRLIHRQFSGAFYESRSQPYPYDFLNRIVASAGVSREDTSVARLRKLARYKDAFVEGCFRELSRFSKRTNIPIAVVVLRLRAGNRPPPHLIAQRAEANELLVLRVFNAYEGRSPQEMYLGTYSRADQLGGDAHASALAHRLLADDLFDQIVNHPTLGRLITDTSLPSQKE